jgi:hypothetical protein
MKTFVRVLQIVGVCVFIVTLIITVLFAEGYQFDPETHSIVKKSVFYFEGIPEGGSVFVDGQLKDITIPREVRVLPGYHAIEIKKPGFISWKKNIKLPPDTVIRFASIKLLPDSYDIPFMKQIGASNGWTVKYFGSAGVLLDNKNLKFAKYFDLKSSKNVQIIDVNIKLAYSKLVPFSDRELIGLTEDGRLFSYDIKDQTVLISKNKGFVDLQATDDSVFTLTKTGVVSEIDGDIDDLKEYLSIPDNVFNKIISAESFGGRNAFILGSNKGNVLVVTESASSIVFQEKNADSAFLDNNSVSYTKGPKLYVYDLLSKEAAYSKNLDKSVKWISRISDSYHFLFLMADGGLKYCDEDYENCHLLGVVDSDSVFAHAKTGTLFFTIMKGKFTLFDFADESFLKSILKNFVSGIFGQLDRARF